MKKKRKRTRQEWLELVTEFRQSGQTQKEFAHTHRLNLHTFQNWIYDKDAQPPKSKEGTSKESKEHQLQRHADQFLTYSKEILNAVPQELLSSSRDLYLPAHATNEPWSETDSGAPPILHVAINLNMPRKYILLLVDYFVDGFRRDKERPQEPRLDSENKSNFKYKLESYPKKGTSDWTHDKDVELVRLYYHTEMTVAEITRTLFPEIMAWIRTKEKEEQRKQMKQLSERVSARIQELRTFFSLPNKQLSPSPPPEKTIKTDK